MIIDEETYLHHSNLEHHGVKGMKWGVRGGKATTGMTRFRASTVEGNNKLIKLHEDIRDGKASKLLNALAAPDRKIMGEKGFKNYHNAHIETLKEQNRRISSGKLRITDHLKVANQPVGRVFFTHNIDHPKPSTVRDLVRS